MNHDLAEEIRGTSSRSLRIFLLGVATGTVIGLLAATRSGRETLKALVGTPDGVEKVEAIPDVIHKRVSKMANSGREVVERARHDIGGPRIPNTRTDAPW